MERDAIDVADDLVGRAPKEARRGKYDLADLLLEAADCIRILNDRLELWEDTFYGHNVPPSIARKMVADRARAEEESS